MIQLCFCIGAEWAWIRLTEVIEWPDAQLREFKIRRDRLLARATTFENPLEWVWEALDAIKAAAERDDPRALQEALEKGRRHTG